MAFSDISKKWFAGDHPVNAVAPSVATESLVANSNLVFTAKLAGVDYNDWEINLIDPKGNDKKLAVTVDEAGKAINVSLATGTTGDITSKASDVKTAIEAHAIASKIISVAYADQETGEGVVEEFAGVLDNGVDGTVCQDINVIVQDDKTAQLYINILPNTRHDANWRKLNLVSLPVPEVKGSIAWDPGKTGGDDLTVSVEGNTITFNGNIEWYPADPSVGRDEAGNRVGVQITAPEGFNASGAVVTIGDKTYDDLFTAEKNYFWWYPLVSKAGETFTATVKWNEASEQTFTVKIADTATLEKAL